MTASIHPIRNRTLEQILGEIQRMESERHAWLIIGAGQVERWRNEDEAKGQRWESGR